VRVIAYLVVAVVVASCSGAAPASPAAPAVPAPSIGQTARALGSVDGAPLGYLEYLPPGYGDGQQRPLLVFLHGAGEAGDGSEAALELVDKLGIPSLIAADAWPAERPFVVLAPQYGTEAAEGDCAIAADLAAFLAFAIDHYEVDPTRAYLTGISCGAIGIWDYLAVHGNEVAAAVPIAGHAEWALEKAGCGPLAAVPVWAFHGALDDVVSVVHIEGPMEQIRSCEEARATDMELTVYPDAAHIDPDAWTRTYDLSAGNDIYAWMLGYTTG
jgi:predicted peptidase